MGEREGQAPALPAAEPPAAKAATATEPASAFLRWRSPGFWRGWRRAFAEGGVAACPCSARCWVKRWRNAAIAASDGGLDASGLVKVKPQRSVSRRDCSKLTGVRSTRTRRPRHEARHRTIGRIALEPIGESRLKRLARRREAGLRTVDRLADIFGAQAQVGLFERLPVAADLEHVAAIRIERGIAAGERRHEYRLIAGEVEERDARRLDQRIAELLERRRAFLAGPAGVEVELRGRRPVEPRPEAGQRAEVAELGQARIGVGGQSPDRRAALGNREVEADRRLAAGPAEVGGGCDAPARRFAVLVEPAHAPP